MNRTDITRDEILAIAAEAHVVPETVEATLRGAALRRRSAARERVRAVLGRMGYDVSTDSSRTLP